MRDGLRVGTNVTYNPTPSATRRKRAIRLIGPCRRTARPSPGGAAVAQVPAGTGGVARQLRHWLAFLLLLPVPAPGQPSEVVPPFQPACISSPFGPRAGAGPRASSVHQGIDLPAPAGTWVRAMAPGRVTAIRRIGATGLVVDVTHEDGSIFRYAHLDQVAPALAEGRREVAQGTPLGRVGRSGITYGTHLHLELVVGGQRIDPEPHLGLPRCTRSVRPD